MIPFLKKDINKRDYSDEEKHIFAGKKARIRKLKKSLEKAISKTPPNTKAPLENQRGLLSYA